MKHYRSSISKAARERVITRFRNGRKCEVECVLRGEVVGRRHYYETGELEDECPLKDGLIHGTVYRSDEPGVLLSAEPFVKGLPHGIARQWSWEGELIGTYTMKRGTGIDLWWGEREDGTACLSEARYLKDGGCHGFEWWFDEAGSPHTERHFWKGRLHGIVRRWNSKGRLDRGHPEYWVEGERRTKRQYVRACAERAELPRFQEEENRPQRRFPREIRAKLRQTLPARS